MVLVKSVDINLEKGANNNLAQQGVDLGIVIFYQLLNLIDIQQLTDTLTIFKYEFP